MAEKDRVRSALSDACDRNRLDNAGLDRRGLSVRLVILPAPCAGETCASSATAATPGTAIEPRLFIGAFIISQLSIMGAQ
jgi:hypothetical protein